MTPVNYDVVACALAQAMDDYSQYQTGDIQCGVRAAVRRLCQSLSACDTYFDRELFLNTIDSYRQLKAEGE